MQLETSRNSWAIGVELIHSRHLVTGTAGMTKAAAVFFDVDERLAELSAKGDDLERLNALVDFALFRPALEAPVPRGGPIEGRPAAVRCAWAKTRQPPANGSRFIIPHGPPRSLGIAAWELAPSRFTVGAAYLDSQHERCLKRPRAVSLNLNP
jgi:hypothetical protein